MCKKYTHLTQEQRCMIFGLKASKNSLRQIAKAIGVNVSTVSRELRRNSKQGVYNVVAATDFYNKRRVRDCYLPRMSSMTATQVLLHLQNYVSPQQISGRLAREGIRISHETIYKFIWQDKRDGGNLYQYLRRRGRKYMSRANRKAGRWLIPNRVDISEREAIVETKSRIGDWEADTVIGAGRSGVIVTLAERHSKIVLFQRVADKSKESVCTAIIEMLTPFKDKAFTITYDNGGEFADHEKIATALNVSCYFARPYHSWERGLSEHSNGLLRQFVPKKMKITELSNADLANYQDLINSRPRKVLGYLTPNEVFFAQTDIKQSCS